MQRLTGPHHYRRKVAAAAVLALVGVGYFLTWDYRLTAPATLEGLVQRVVAVPFDGYLSSEHARAGDTVRSGQVLAALDDRELVLKRLRAASERGQAIAKHSKALAERKASDVKVLEAEIEQTDAGIALLDEQISRSKLLAPFDGIIVTGDSNQAIGSSVERGKSLFEITPLDRYRVIIQVEDADVTWVEVGQTGAVLLSAVPHDPMPLTVTKITPVAEAREGRNAFRVEAELVNNSSGLRPGMKGVAKINVNEQRLVWIWSHKLWNWLRIQLWTWWP